MRSYVDSVDLQVAIYDGRLMAYSPGFNASREVLLAIRQCNHQRVEHLLDGLAGALRSQREAGAGLGSSLWDLACAVQRLAGLPAVKGRRKDFWQEVLHVAWRRYARKGYRTCIILCYILIMHLYDPK